MLDIDSNQQAAAKARAETKDVNGRYGPAFQRFLKSGLK